MIFIQSEPWFNVQMARYSETLLDRVEVNRVVGFYPNTAAPPAHTPLEYTSKVLTPQHVYPRIKNFGQ